MYHFTVMRIEHFMNMRNRNTIYYYYYYYYLEIAIGQFRPVIDIVLGGHQTELVFA